MGNEDRSTRGFGEAMRSAYSTHGVETGDLDRAVLGRAREVVRAEARGGLLGNWWALGSGGAALAACAIGVCVWVWGGGERVPGDVDGDGVVTVLDAYGIALGVESGRVEESWDVDGDGVVTRGDAEWIAQMAVTLDGGVS